MSRPGAHLHPNGATFSVVSRHANGVSVVLFDAADRETGRIPLDKISPSRWAGFVPGVAAGQRYGLRIDGPFAPEVGHRFDASKLLVDPYATRIDRPFAYDPKLGIRGIDTAALVPKSILEATLPPLSPLPPRKPGFIYEVSARSFTRLHPEIPPAQRGTVAALAHPAVIDHLKRLGVDTVELMPLTASIDERHLPPHGLTNAWGYNPITFFTPDPRLMPGGMADLRQAVAALHAADIAVILDVVFNHTGESDVFGPTLSLRGLDNALYYRHVGADLCNDSGCGNTLALDRPETVALVMDALRHWATAGLDGFRYDLAPVMGRRVNGFDPHAPLLAAITQDPALRNLIHVAEPWDIGPGGYQVGAFPEPFLEWNDRYRDDIRRFWRGDAVGVGALATRLAGSSDLYAVSGRGPATSVNFVAAHDGMTLADCVAYLTKHNEANGEDNRDGTSENHSWNHGVEGPSSDPVIQSARHADLKAMLATLFLSRGTVMLTAGDEFGRTQGGNNNAYAQDNAMTWLDWQGRDRALEGFVAELAWLRREHPVLTGDRWLTGTGEPPDVVWRGARRPMSGADWADPVRPLLVVELTKSGGEGDRLVLAFNRGASVSISLPKARTGAKWHCLLATGAVTVSGATARLSESMVAVFSDMNVG